MEEQTTQQKSEQEDENSNTKEVIKADEQVVDLNDNNDEVSSTSSLDSENDNSDFEESEDIIDFEETGYIMKPNEDHESESDYSLSSESIDSSPNSYKNEKWSGYKVNHFCF